MLWYLSCNEQQKLLCMDIGAGLSEASMEFCWGGKQREKKKRTATTSKFLFYIIYNVQKGIYYMKFWLVVRYGCTAYLLNSLCILMKMQSDFDRVVLLKANWHICR